MVRPNCLNCLIFFLSIFSPNFILAENVTYYGHIQSLVDEKCTYCHNDEGLSFPLDTYEALYNFRLPASDAVIQRRMPPWLAANGVREYIGNISLSDSQIALWKAWQKNDFKKGSETNNQKSSVEDDLEKVRFKADLELDLLPKGAKYFPNPNLNDEYRCFLLEWPFEKNNYIRGVRFETPQTSIVHHSLIYVSSAKSAEIFRYLDSKDEAEGYRCFGSIFPTDRRLNYTKLRDLKVKDYEFARKTRRLPKFEKNKSVIAFLHENTAFLSAFGLVSFSHSFQGSGTPMEPGSLVIVQLHINNIKDKVTSLTDGTVKFTVADDVESPGMYLSVTDWNWQFEPKNGELTVPPGKSISIEDTTRFTALFRELKKTIGRGKKYSGMKIHSAGIHMHSIGESGESSVVDREGNLVDKLVEIPRWDFAWQKDFVFEKPLEYNLEQIKQLSFKIRCDYFNPGSTAVVGGLKSEEEMCYNFGYFSLIPAKDEQSRN